MHIAGIMSAMSEAPANLPPTEANARAVAGLSQCDVRTARRYLEGEPIKGAALRERLALAANKVRAMNAESPK